MQNAQQDQFIEKCVKDILKPLKNEKYLLKIKKENAVESKSKIIDEQEKLLESYVRLIATRVMLLKSEYNPTFRDIQNFYETCLNETRNVFLSLQDNKPLKTQILYKLEIIANFCIKLLTLGYHPHFFTFTPVNPNENMDKVNSLINYIKSTLSKCISSAEHQLVDVPNENNIITPQI